MSFAPGDLIVYSRETWGGDLDPDEHNYTGFILDVRVIYPGDLTRMPVDVIGAGGDPADGIACYHIMWCDGCARGSPVPTFSWDRANYIDKWYELA